MFLPADEVHIWRAHLDVSATQLACYERSLSADELQRAQRAHAPADRQRFVVRRGMLRAVLGRYLGIAPANIRFAYSAYGKPMLSAESGGDTLCFSVSHASAQVLYAVTRGRAIGVDIERKRDSFEFDQIAKHLFAREEQAFLERLPAFERPEAFFRLWACKEAYVKACGIGLALALDTFAIALDPVTPARLLYGHAGVRTADWQMRELALGEGYAAAVAVQGTHWRLKNWHYAA